MASSFAVSRAAATLASAAGVGSSSPSHAAVRHDLLRLFSTAKRGRPSMGRALGSALADVASTHTSALRAGALPALGAPGMAGFGANPLVSVLGPRYFSLGLRMSAADYFTRRLHPEVLRRLETTANREPGNVTAQMLYLQALSKCVGTCACRRGERRRPCR